MIIDPPLPIIVTPNNVLAVCAWLGYATLARPLKLGYSHNPWRMVVHDVDGEPVTGGGTITRPVELTELFARRMSYEVHISTIESWVPPSAVMGATRAQCEQAHRDEMRRVVDALTTYHRETPQ